MLKRIVCLCVFLFAVSVINSLKEIENISWQINEIDRTLNSFDINRKLF